MQRSLGSSSVPSTSKSADLLGETSPLTVLIVEPRLDELVPMVDALAAAGFDVTATATYDEAKPLICSKPPAILITALRLGVYNGLHLVLRGKSVRGDMAAIVTAPSHDPVLEADAAHMGARFVVGPIAGKELIAAVLHAYYGRFGNGNSVMEGPFERRTRERRAQPLDVTPERRGGDRRRQLPWLRT